MSEGGVGVLDRGSGLAVLCTLAQRFIGPYKVLNQVNSDDMSFCLVFNLSVSLRALLAMSCDWLFASRL